MDKYTAKEIAGDKKLIKEVENGNIRKCSLINPWKDSIFVKFQIIQAWIIYIPILHFDIEFKIRENPNLGGVVVDALNSSLFAR